MAILGDDCYKCYAIFTLPQLIKTSLMFETFWTWLSGHFNFLVLFGFFGQGLFMMRFVAQWLASEKAKRTVVPEVFWYFSLAGGFITLIYAILKNDIVFMLAQFFGTFIYIRNIAILWRARLREHHANDEHLLEALADKAAGLLTKVQKGEALTDHERRQAIAAMRLFENGDKG